MTGETLESSKHHMLCCSFFQLLMSNISKKSMRDATLDKYRNKNEGLPHLRNRSISLNSPLPLLKRNLTAAKNVKIFYESMRSKMLNLHRNSKNISFKNSLKMQGLVGFCLKQHNCLLWGHLSVSKDSMRGFLIPLITH